MEAIVDFLIGNWKPILSMTFSVAAGVYAYFVKKSNQLSLAEANEKDRALRERQNNWDNAENIRQEMEEMNEVLTKELKEKGVEIGEWREKYFSLQGQFHEALLENKRIQYDYRQIVELFDKKNGDLISHLKALKAFKDKQK